MENNELTRKNAHIKAAQLLAEEFYWSPVEESGPFGSDAGSDAGYGFKDWRKTNPDKSPVNFLNELLTRWAIPRFDVLEINEDKVLEFINKKSEQNRDLSQIKEMLKNFQPGVNEDLLQHVLNNVKESMGGRYLLEQDNAIIGIGFCQFAIEGKIDPDIQNLVRLALTRQLLPCLIERYSTDYQPIRKEQLSKMLNKLDMMNK